LLWPAAALVAALASCSPGPFRARGIHAARVCASSLRLRVILYAPVAPRCIGGPVAEVVAWPPAGRILLGLLVGGIVPPTGASCPGFAAASCRRGE